MSLFTTENEAVAWKDCPNKIQVSASNEKLHYISYRIFFLSSQGCKTIAAGKKKIYMQPAEASISQFLVCYSFHRYMQLKFHIKSLGCHWSQDHNMISCFRIGFNKDSCIMMHLFLFPGNCLNSQQFSNNLKILNIFNDRIQYMPWLLICEHNIPFTWGKWEFA